MTFIVGQCDALTIKPIEDLCLNDGTHVKLDLKTPAIAPCISFPDPAHFWNYTHTITAFDLLHIYRRDLGISVTFWDINGTGFYRTKIASVLVKPVDQDIRPISVRCRSPKRRTDVLGETNKMANIFYLPKGKKIQIKKNMKSEIRHYTGTGSEQCNLFTKGF